MRVPILDGTRQLAPAVDGFVLMLALPEDERLTAGLVGRAQQCGSGGRRCGSNQKSASVNLLILPPLFIKSNFKLKSARDVRSFTCARALPFLLPVRDPQIATRSASSPRRWAHPNGWFWTDRDFAHCRTNCRSTQWSPASCLWAARTGVSENRSPASGSHNAAHSVSPRDGHRDRWLPWSCFSRESACARYRPGRSDLSGR